MSSESKSFSKPDYKYKDGRVVNMETGATKIPK